MEQRILAATLATLTEVGPNRLSVRKVATRANVATTTLYRRWPSKQALLAAALAHTFRRQDPLPDTGSLRDDLLALCNARAQLYRSAAGRWIVPTMAHLREAGGLGRAVGEAARSERAPFSEVVRRGIDRGQVAAEVNPEIVAELIVGGLTARFLSRRALDRTFVADVVDHLMCGLSPGGPNAQFRYQWLRSSQ